MECVEPPERSTATKWLSWAPGPRTPSPLPADYKLRLLASSLNAVEARATILAERCAAQKFQTELYANRLQGANAIIAVVARAAAQKQAGLAEEVRDTAIATFDSHN